MRTRVLLFSFKAIKLPIDACPNDSGPNTVMALLVQYLPSLNGAQPLILGRGIGHLGIGRIAEDTLRSLHGLGHIDCRALRYVSLDTPDILRG